MPEEIFILQKKDELQNLSQLYNPHDCKLSLLAKETIIENLTARNESLLQTIEDLKLQMKNMTVDFSNNLEIHNKHRNTLARENLGLESDVKMLQANLKELNSQNKILEKSLTQKNSELKSVNKALNLKSDQLRALQKLIVIREERITELNNSILANIGS